VIDISLSLSLQQWRGEQLAELCGVVVITHSGRRELEHRIVINVLVDTRRR
jgi:hypothetical protein